MKVLQYLERAYVIILMRAYTCIHTGVGHTGSKSAQHFQLGNTQKFFLCSRRGSNLILRSSNLESEPLPSHPIIYLITNYMICFSVCFCVNLLSSLFILIVNRLYSVSHDSRRWGTWISLHNRRSPIGWCSSLQRTTYCTTGCTHTFQPCTGRKRSRSSLRVFTSATREFDRMNCKCKCKSVKY